MTCEYFASRTHNFFPAEPLLLLIWQLRRPITREDNCMPAPFWWNKGDRQIFLLLFSDCCAVMSFNLILILILNYWIYMLPLEGKFTPVK